MTDHFIDLHVHMSLTDPHGVCGESDCRQLLLGAREANVAAVVITPHTDAYRPAADWQADIEQTAAYCRRVAPDIAVSSGSEFLLRHVQDVLLAERGLVPTLNRSNYLLIEFLPDVRSSFVSECVHELRVRRLVPIIAHPERYQTFQRSPDKLRQLLTDGALLQGTMSALLGIHGSHVRQALWAMLKSDCITCLASDFHGGNYAAVVQESSALLTRQLGRLAARLLLFDRPGQILS